MTEWRKTGTTSGLVTPRGHAQVWLDPSGEWGWQAWLAEPHRGRGDEHYGWTPTEEEARLAAELHLGVST